MKTTWCIWRTGIKTPKEDHFAIDMKVNEWTIKILFQKLEDTWAVLQGLKLDNPIGQDLHWTVVDHLNDYTIVDNKNRAKFCWKRIQVCWIRRLARWINERSGCILSLLINLQDLWDRRNQFSVEQIIERLYQCKQGTVEFPDDVEVLAQNLVERSFWEEKTEHFFAVQLIDTENNRSNDSQKGWTRLQTRRFSPSFSSPRPGRPKCMPGWANIRTAVKWNWKEDVNSRSHCNVACWLYQFWNTRVTPKTNWKTRGATHLISKAKNITKQTTIWAKGATS